MRCSINPEKCQYASNMKDRPNSRCLKFDDAAECPKCLSFRKKQSKHDRVKAIKEAINNYDFGSKKVQAYLNKQEKNPISPIIRYCYPDNQRKQDYLDSLDEVSKKLVKNGTKPYPIECYSKHQQKDIFAYNANNEVITTN